MWTVECIIKTPEMLSEVIGIAGTRIQAIDLADDVKTRIDPEASWVQKIASEDILVWEHDGCFIKIKRR